MDAIHLVTNRHRLLVVDDNHDCADSVCELIRMTCDWEVEVAYGPVAALSQALAHPPDAVFLDMEMPGMSGFQTADRLRDAQSVTLPHLVAMTGNSNLQLEASDDLRFDASLLKPASHDELLELLAGFAAMKTP